MYTLADQHRLRPWPEKAVIFPEGSLLAPDPCARPSGELRVGLTSPHLLGRKKPARCDSCEPSPPASATLLRGGLPAEAGCLILPRSAVSIPLSPTIEKKNIVCLMSPAYLVLPGCRRYLRVTAVREVNPNFPPKTGAAVNREAEVDQLSRR